MVTSLTVATVIAALMLLFGNPIVSWAMEKLGMARTVAKGDLLVTSDGELVIDEVLPRSRALLVEPEKHVHVQFDPKEGDIPPCGGGVGDILEWEIFIKPDGHGQEEIRLKIRWSVTTSRHITWSVSV